MLLPAVIGFSLVNSSGSYYFHTFGKSFGEFNTRMLFNKKIPVGLKSQNRVPACTQYNMSSVVESEEKFGLNRDRNMGNLVLRFREDAERCTGTVIYI